jgi:hypothetical protein
VRGRHLRHVLLGIVLLIGVVVAIDPHPFARLDAAPTVVEALPRITGATATTVPPTTAPQPVETAPTTSPPPATVPTTTPPPATGPPDTTAPAPLAPSPPAPTPPRATIARAHAAGLLVYGHEGDRVADQAIAGTTEFGNPRFLLTTQLRGDWVQVLLPVRPNGAEGWVRAADVELSSVPDRIDVDLAAHTLTWTRDGVVALETAAGIGSPWTPTPAGTFYVTDVLPFDPSQGRGRWVVALDGHSDAYATFEGGDARIAIHGTSDPSSVGQSVSNGCVRIADGPLDQLRAAVPLGTPVVVH